MLESCVPQKSCVLALVGALLMAGCGSSGSPSAPSSSGGGTTTTGKFQTTGRLIDAVSSAGVAGVTPTTTDTRTTYLSATDANGAFTLGVDVATTGGMVFSFAGTSILTRQTFIKVPGDAVTVSVIPKTFDLVSFDQMFRGTESKLLRWTTAPPLVVVTQVMQFTNANDTQFTTTSDSISDADANAIIADLTTGLPLMTGNQFPAFQSALKAPSGAGAVVQMAQTGRITVGRLAGLRAATGSVGLSRWQYLSDGTVNGGVLILDRDFDVAGSADVRSVRIHELGHTLGYTHVTSRTSIMNASPTGDPNAADITAAKIAFLRPPGSKSPDTDPSSFSINGVQAAKGTWSAPIR